MKIMFLGLAGAIAASALTPTAADAQRWRDDRGWHDGGYRHHGRWHHPPRGYYRGGYWNGRRWHRGPRYRSVCRWHHGRYGRQEVCRRRW